MPPVTMMAFITHCWKSAPLERPGPRARWVASTRALWALLLAVALWPALALAQVPGEVVDMQIERQDERLLLSAALNFELPELVQDALQRGIPMYFIAEAEIQRERWYWWDKTVAQAQRYLRLSYQPLTRRWRLHVSATPFANAGLGMALGQSFDDSAEALAMLQRLSRWPIAQASELEPQARYQVQLRFKVDLSQMPRPLQISALGPRSGWNLLLTRTQTLPPQVLAP